jgi:hypothetical protein
MVERIRQRMGSSGSSVPRQPPTDPNLRRRMEGHGSAGNARSMHGDGHSGSGHDNDYDSDFSDVSMV